MNQLITGTPEQHKLFDLMLGPIRWQMVQFSIENKLFDHFTSPVRAEVIAGRLKLRPHKLKLLLNALAALNIFVKEDDHYHVAHSYLPYLNSGSEQYLGETLSHLGKVKSMNSAFLADAICLEKKSQPEANNHDFDVWEESINDLRCFHKSIRNSILLPLLKKQHQWQSVTSILDLGAGSIQLAQDIFLSKPETMVSLFDLPACCNPLKKQLDQDSPTLTGNIRLVSGDMNHDDFCGQYGLILAAMSLYFANNLTQCIKKIYDALLPNGLFVSFHEALNEQRTGPIFHVIGRLPVELANGSLSLHAGEIEYALSINQFHNIQSQTLSTPFGEMSFITATK